MQNCIHGADKFRMCGMEVCKLYEKYFPVNMIRPFWKKFIFIRWWTRCFILKITYWWKYCSVSLCIKYIWVVTGRRASVWDEDIGKDTIECSESRTRFSCGTGTSIFIRMSFKSSSFISSDGYSSCDHSNWKSDILLWFVIWVVCTQCPADGFF